MLGWSCGTSYCGRHTILILNGLSDDRILLTCNNNITVQDDILESGPRLYLCEM